MSFLIMLSFLKHIKLIRYLLVWKVNSSLVRLPDCLSLEISQVLGTIIAQSLPTKQASQWQKAMGSRNNTHVGDAKNKQANTLEIEWPIGAVLSVYPGKLTYGTGEVILWELKLFGDWADHGFFLRVILPAMEEASYTTDLRWNRRNGLWGHFDIYAAYVAQGRQWKPLVNDGRLNLRRRINPIQWTEGLDLDPALKKVYFCLDWLTPFSLKDIQLTASAISVLGNIQEGMYDSTLNLKGILEILIYRLSQLIPGRYNAPEDVLNILTPKEQSSFFEVMEQAGQVPVISKNLKMAPSNWPGCCIGKQIFGPIPLSIIPYLELASILHVGRHTHFGCGTFTLT